MRAAATLLPLLLLTAAPLEAATLRVGPGEAFATPSAAAAAARDGDRVTIAPGAYYDCAVWTASDLTVSGDAAGATVLTDTACDGKASFVVRGERVTLRDLTFTRIRVADHNGAGVRAEGGSVTVEHSRFVDDQIGILAADAPGATLVVRDCIFAANGRRDGADGTDGGRAADIGAGDIARLVVERSRFEGARGPSVVSRARRSELAGNSFAPGAAPRPFVVAAPAGGSLILEDNEIVLADIAALAAVWVADGEGPVALRRTVLRSPPGRPAVLLRDWSRATPVLEGNVLGPGDREVSDQGALWHRLTGVAHRLLDGLRGGLAELRRLVAGMLRG